MLISLFDQYNTPTKSLLRSLKTAKISTLALFCQYDGVLPTGAISPFTHFAVDKSSSIKGRFFNQVEMPPFYEVRHENPDYASIYHDGFLRGKVFYRAGSFREARAVTWYSLEQKETKTDLYNQVGVLYAQQYYEQGKICQTAYLKDGQETILINEKTGRITLYHEGKILQFLNLSAFVLYFLEDLEQVREDSQFLINSLSYPLFVLRRKLNTPAATLFWQETMSQIPGNMVDELKHNVALKQIVFEERAYLERVQKEFPDTWLALNYLSPIGEFTARKTSNKQALIVTQSDVLLDFDELLSEFPQLNFVVCAKTNMSDKLYTYQKNHDNLILKPNISEREIEKELSQADFYLDIHQGMEVDQLIKRAYEANLLILARSQTAKNASKELVFPDKDELFQALGQASQSLLSYKKMLLQQQEQKGERTDKKQWMKIVCE